MTQESEWREVTIPIPELVRRIGWWLAGCGVLVGLPYVVLYGWPEALTGPFTFEGLGRVSFGLVMVMVAYIVSVPIHEGLHAAGMLLTGTPRSAISFGARLRQGVVYIHCSHAMPLSAYRFSLLLPVIVTGLAPAVWGLATGDGWIVLYAYLMIVSAIGDLEMVWLLRKMDSSTVVRDHPSKLGCEVQMSPPMAGR